MYPKNPLLAVCSSLQQKHIKNHCNDLISVSMLIIILSRQLNKRSLLYSAVYVRGYRLGIETVDLIKQNAKTKSARENVTQDPDLHANRRRDDH